MLILAGVSISLVVGNNGVLTQASNAVVETRKAEAREDVAMAIASAETEYWKEWAKDSSIDIKQYFTKARLEKYAPSITDVTAQSDDGSFIVIYTKEGVKYAFYVDGKRKVTSAGVGAANSEYITDFGKLVTGYTGYINYSETDEWRLFYADNNYAYLIKNRIGNTDYKLTDTSVVTGFETSIISILAQNLNIKYTMNGDWALKNNGNDLNRNIKVVAALLDTSKWTEYKTSDAEWTVGAPTLEMYIASCNATHSIQCDCKVENNTATGYLVNKDSGEFNEYISGLGNSLDIDKALYSNGVFNWWLASPSAGDTDRLMYVSTDGSIGHRYSTEKYGICPVAAISLSKIGKAGDNKTITITDNYFND